MICTLVVTSTGSGSVSTNPSNSVYLMGSSVTLTATPAPGYQFDHWENGATGRTNPVQITMNGSKVVNAVFQKVYTLTVNVNSILGGNCSLTPPGGVYNANSYVNVTATPFSGYRFSEWTGDLVSTNNSENVQMTFNKVITANFIQQYVLATGVSTSGGGSVAPVSGNSYDINQTVQVTATINTGFTFVKWSPDVVNTTANPSTVIMNGAKTATAIVTPNYYTLTTSTTGGMGGFITLSNTTGLIKYNSSVTASATPRSGSIFSKWTYNSTSTGSNPYTFTIPASNTTLTAVFTSYSGLPWGMLGFNSKHTGRSPYIGPATNALKWPSPAATGSAVKSSPSVGSDGTIYIGSNDNKLYALDPDDGTTVWTSTLGGSVLSSPAVDPVDGTIYVGCNDKKLYALNPATGASVWTFTGALGLISSSPAIGPDGTIYVGSDDGFLYSVNPENGSLLGQFETGDQIAGSPAVGDDGTVYFGSADKNVYAVYNYSRRKWATALGGSVYGTPSIGSDGTVYVGCSDSKVYALNGSTGAIKWTFTAGGPVNGGIAIGMDGIIYFGDGATTPNLWAVTSGGNSKWSYAFSGATSGFMIDAAPSIGLYTGLDLSGYYTYYIYVGSYNGLYAFNSYTGALVSALSYTGTGAVHTSPAIDDGVVYFGSDDGYVYAIGP
jgi:outer membrane protein assembly factor BamB